MAVFEINNAKLHYVFNDNGKANTVLLGHSYLFDGAMWDPQIVELSKHWNLVIPDLWGHGNSDSIDLSSYSLKQLADDYADLMHHLNIENYHVVGLSVGGMWGAHMALNYPDRVKALVLMDTDLHEESMETRAKYFALLDHVKKDGEITEKMAENLTRYFHSHNPDTFLVSAIKAKILELQPHNIKCIYELGKFIFARTSILDQLPDLKMPVMVAVGSQDAPRPPFESKRIQENIGDNAQYYEIPDAGHLSNMENPNDANTMLVGFLQTAEVSEHEHC